MGYGRRVVARMLIDAGADPNLLDGTGTTPLMSAAGTGGLAILELLIARGAARARSHCRFALPLIHFTPVH